MLLLACNKTIPLNRKAATTTSILPKGKTFTKQNRIKNNQHNRIKKKASSSSNAIRWPAKHVHTTTNGFPATTNNGFPTTTNNGLPATNDGRFPRERFPATCCVSKYEFAFCKYKLSSEPILKKEVCLKKRNHEYQWIYIDIFGVFFK